MTIIPQTDFPDSTIAFLLYGYDFISRTCEKKNSDIFKTRLLLQKFFCMKGQEAAAVIYNTGFFERKGAAPGRLKHTLFGKGGVQGLDGERHRARKSLFISMLKPEQLGCLTQLFWEQLYLYAKKWESQEEVVLFDDFEEILCRAVCGWVGVPIRDDEVAFRTRQFSSIIDSSGAVGPRHWRGIRARKRVDSWLRSLLKKVRRGQLRIPESWILHKIAFYREPNGSLLDIRAAAVELNNVLRPTIAVARFIVFEALAIHDYKGIAKKLRNAHDDYVKWFVQEVRRFYPFFPFVVAKVKKDFEWRGYQFPRGRKVLLDLYGTDHDPRIWENPQEFCPERFKNWNGGAFNFIPQGGGDHLENHRCPGEWVTIELMKNAAKFLTRTISYEVPKQDLSISHSRIPAQPKSRFKIRNVRVL